jgi:hypothetical protein
MAQLKEVYIKKTQFSMIQFTFWILTYEECGLLGWQHSPDGENAVAPVLHRAA